MACTMFLKKICLLFLIVTSIIQCVEANPTSNNFDLWKKPTRLEKTKFTHSANKKTSIQSSGKKNIIVQKPLLVQLQAPQFLREGDRIELNAKIIKNLRYFKFKTVIYNLLRNFRLKRLFK